MSQTKTFKSERAAKQAFTKQYKVWRTAQAARIDAAHTRGEPTTEQRAELTRLEETYKSLQGDERYNSSAWEAHHALWNAITDGPRERAQGAEDAAWAAMKEVYDQAKSQGFWCGSEAAYQFGYNPTRDLILNNCD